MKRIATISLVISFLSATTINIPADYATIQEGINAAVDGDIVGVDFIPAKDREKGKPYFIEVNSTPGLVGIEALGSSAPSRPIIKSVKSDKKRSINTDILTTYMNRDNWRK